MDNDEDEDGNFTKWMSSYWGHNAGEEQTKERRHSFRRPSKPYSGRRASLPCPSQLDAMQLNRLHAATMAPAPAHLKSRDKKEARPHNNVFHTPLLTPMEDNSQARSPRLDQRITTINELSETFERKLKFRSRNVMSLSDADDLCMICHENMRSCGTVVTELHCSHHFHKECIEQWLWKKQSCPTCHIHVAMPEPFYWSSGRVKVP
ncbi:leukemia NUP98 fusion partner 1 [Megalops cyprinoides]|uniref:leukemia NUP98 fusion partner 1 n=1 Tax=Megalops cyprinoides TaxID=118141 RepID=UPI0018640D7E|nr:leukemia NUP98 fusion partner 1 [Megalops cyprinoides]